MIKILFILLTLFISGVCQAEMLAISGVIEFSSNAYTYRDNVYNWVISRSTNFWSAQSNISKSDYTEIVGSVTAHYDINFDIRIKTETEKVNIENYIKLIKLDSRISKMRLHLHRCFHDEGKSCIDKSWEIK